MSKRASFVLWACAVVALLGIILPVLIVIPIAFSASSAFALRPGGYTLRWFVAAWNWNGGAFRESFRSSVLLGISVALSSLFLGTLSALAITRGTRSFPRWVSTLLFTPLLIPTIVSGIALLQVFAVFGLLGSWLSIYMAHVAITLPFAVRTMVSTMAGISRSCEEAAAVLGATRVQTLVRVTLPMARQGMLAGGVFAFIISWDEAVVATILGGAHTLTFPVRLLSYLYDQFDPLVAAVSTILLAITLLALSVLTRTLGIERLVGSW